MEGINIPIGNAEQGKKLFMKICASCHTIEEGGKHLQGPNLFGIIGSKPGAKEDFSYSAGNKQADFIWTRDILFLYLYSPQYIIPGSVKKRSFIGPLQGQERADIATYVEQASGNNAEIKFDAKYK